MKSLYTTAAFFYKDLLLAFRDRTKFFTPLFFGMITLFLFSFAFAYEPTLLQKLASGLIWLTVLLSSLLHLETSFEKEIENGSLDNWLLQNGNSRALFLGKCGVQFFWILIIQMLVIFQMFVLFNLNTPKNLWLFFEVILLGDFGMAILGTFYAALLCKLKGKQMIFPLLFLPMLIPLLLAAVFATEQAFLGNLFQEATLWLKLLAIFDTVFFTATLLVIEWLLDAL